MTLSTELQSYIRNMPKVELHVHLEGSVRPETLLNLAQRHSISLPADDLASIREWYTFRDLPHFIDIYIKISECIRTVEDIELIAREFLAGQAAQNVRYTEVTYTAFTHCKQKGITFDDQLDALNRARAWARVTHGVDMGIIIDIPRGFATPEDAMDIAEWAVSSIGNGVAALGLGGTEVGNPPEDYTYAFQYALEQGLASAPHAGETVGPASIRGAITALGAQRIGHGVRCIEDPTLVEYLQQTQIPLEVCPSSNVCLGVVPSFEDHMLPRLLFNGLYVTINSDDPPMFNTTLTDEYLLAADAFGFDQSTVKQLVMNAVNATFLSKMSQTKMRAEFETLFRQLEANPSN